MNFLELQSRCEFDNCHSFSNDRRDVMYSTADQQKPRLHWAPLGTTDKPRLLSVVLNVLYWVCRIDLVTKRATCVSLSPTTYEHFSIAIRTNGSGKLEWQILNRKIAKIFILLQDVIIAKIFILLQDVIAPPLQFGVSFQRWNTTRLYIVNDRFCSVLIMFYIIKHLGMCEKVLFFISVVQWQSISMISKLWYNLISVSYD